jgi:hypothetical protein
MIFIDIHSEEVNQCDSGYPLDIHDEADSRFLPAAKYIDVTTSKGCEGDTGT